MLETPARPSPFIRFEKISKFYPGVRALDGVSFGISEGSIHALLGENGAGKSTLLKVLSGAHLPSAGTLNIAGQSTLFRSTAAALEAGVAVIYQELHLVPELTVAENLFLGHFPTRAGVIQKRRLQQNAIELLERIGERIDPKTRISRLPIGQRQMIEIAKALSRGAKIIAFDEPTSSLSAREITRLFDVIRELQRRQCAVLYVTHRMEEVYTLCDAATVLRDGKHVATFPSLTGLTSDSIVRAMVGRDIADIYNYQSSEQRRLSAPQKTPVPGSEPALDVRGIAGRGLRQPISLQINSGEIVGLFGLVGAGRSELLKLIYGAVQPTAGRVAVHGSVAPIRKPAHAIRSGLLLCPEDRKREGIFPIASVMENINISARRLHCSMRFLLNNKWERENAGKRITELNVKTPTLRQQIRFLSGGNQQKVILGRWLSENVTVLLLDEPTRGIDIGAKAEIYSIIYTLAAAGIAILVVSSDLPEVLGVSDRLLVMREGSLAGELPRAQYSPERALNLALPGSARESSTNSEGAQ